MVELSLATPASLTNYDSFWLGPFGAARLKGAYKLILKISALSFLRCDEMLTRTFASGGKILQFDVQTPGDHQRLRAKIPVSQDPAKQS